MIFTNVHTNTANSPVRQANRIGINTVFPAALILYTSENKKTPEQMLYIIAAALNMEYQDYQAKGRKTDLVELRFIGAYLLRTFYPRLTLKQIGIMFGGKDHTSIINAVARANDLLYTHDPVFDYKYNTALNTVIKWLNETEYEHN